MAACAPRASRAPRAVMRSWPARPCSVMQRRKWKPGGRGETLRTAHRPGLMHPPASLSSTVVHDLGTTLRFFSSNHLNRICVCRCVCRCAVERPSAHSHALLPPSRKWIVFQIRGPTSSRDAGLGRRGPPNCCQQCDRIGDAGSSPAPLAAEAKLNSFFPVKKIIIGNGNWYSCPARLPPADESLAVPGLCGTACVHAAHAPYRPASTCSLLRQMLTLPAAGGVRRARRGVRPS